MSATRPTTIQQRQEIMQLAQTGLSHQAIAQDVGMSVWTARKWARQTRSGDLAALVSHVGRPVAGSLLSGRRPPPSAGRCGLDRTQHRVSPAGGGL